MKRKILIADDEVRIRILLNDFLSNAGYQVIEAKNGAQAIDLYFADQKIDLVILDVMMPILNGWEVCESIRKISDVPIIMLTAKNAEKDELNGFTKGADEYIKKPFSPTVLVARVAALLNRTYGSTNILTVGDFTLNEEKFTVVYKENSLDLSQKEFSLFLYLVRNEGKAVTREQILNNVWGYDYAGTDRTVDTHMNRLRMKLSAHNDCIKTIRGHGYKFEVIK